MHSLCSRKPHRHRRPAVVAADGWLGIVEAGDLYDPEAGSGSLEDAYDEHGARVINLPWVRPGNTYGPDAQDIDGFQESHADAIVIVPVGNFGWPLPGQVNDIGTTKSGLVVGAHMAPDDHVDPQRINWRGPNSSMGRRKDLLQHSE